MNKSGPSYNASGKGLTASATKRRGNKSGSSIGYYAATTTPSAARAEKPRSAYGA